MNKLTKIAVIVLAVLFVLAIGKNFLVKAAIENGVSLATGLDLSMKSLRVGILDTSIRIKELKIKNPKDFEEPIMLDMPEITIDYNLRDIIGGNIHLEKVVVNLAQFNVVTNKEGVSNLDAIKPKKKEKAEKPKKESKEKGAAPEFQIDDLQLKVTKIAFINYAKTEKPIITDFDINLDEHYQNITSAADIFGIFVKVLLTKMPLAILSGVDLSNLQGLASGAVADVEKLAGGALKQVEQLVESVDVGKLKDIGAESLSKVGDLGAGSLDKLKGFGTGATANVQDFGGSAAETVGAAADKATDAAKSAVKGLTGLASKLKLPGSGDATE